MKKKVQWLPMAALVLVVAGCAAAESAKSGGASTDAAADSGAPFNQAAIRGGAEFAEPSTGSGHAQPLTEMSTASMTAQRHVIRNGSIALRVEDVEKAEKQISLMVAKGGGYVENTRFSGLGESNPTVDMTVRVPAKGFEDSMATLAELGVVLDKSVEARDVTAEIVDLGARVKTLLAKEETLREMLRQSRQLNDVMALQDRLTQVRTEIERMEAQRKSLSELAALSTIQVHLTQNATVPTVAAAADPNWFNHTIGGATTSFMASFRWLVGVLTWIVVYSPFWLLPILGAWWLVKKLARQSPPVMGSQ